MSEDEKFIKFKEIYDEIKEQWEYLEKQGFNDEQILIIEKLIANKEYLAKQELSKYRKLYDIALEDSVRTSRSLMEYRENSKNAIEYETKLLNVLDRYKEANKKAIEYIKSKEHEPDASMYCELGEYKEYKDLLKILEVEDE